ncbi:hypothetical protein PF011_g27897 [Phytophthora fragariae]|uniref:Uncharacterized protein n=1 Tax=Phytophthora fragariae TaxID=53985 RepID=A0A6A3HD50_9STRA|nr:hypothetical protein PF011_g27897 [Phytophthora fragariae]
MVTTTRSGGSRLLSSNVTKKLDDIARLYPAYNDDADDYGEVEPSARRDKGPAKPWGNRLWFNGDSSAANSVQPTRRRLIQRPGWRISGNDDSSDDWRALMDHGDDGDDLATELSRQIREAMANGSDRCASEAYTFGRSDSRSLRDRRPKRSSGRDERHPKVQYIHADVDEGKWPDGASEADGDYSLVFGKGRDARLGGGALSSEGSSGPSRSCVESDERGFNDQHPGKCVGNTNFSLGFSDKALDPAEQTPNQARRNASGTIKRLIDQESSIEETPKVTGTPAEDSVLHHTDVSVCRRNDRCPGCFGRLGSSVEDYT